MGVPGADRHRAAGAGRVTCLGEGGVPLVCVADAPRPSAGGDNARGGG